MTEFTQELLDWQRNFGRHNLPWQYQPTPYRVWVSEIMLQQTQVTTVAPYFERFMKRYPEIQALADATLDEVLHFWTGLGYYARARNMHRTSQHICSNYQGEFPKQLKTLMTLPGIGRSTAGAILSLSFNLPYPILDGNVKRVLTRYHAITGWPGQRSIEKRLWDLAESYTPNDHAASYAQAIMDLGAKICTRSRPLCDGCPVSTGCQARQESLQEILPHKKTKKTLPVRETIFALIENNEGELLLEKRPPTGIWGSLWSFPECHVDEDVSAWIQDNFACRVEAVMHEPKIRHTFSHFHLDIMPVRLKLKSMVNSIQDNPDRCWLGRDQEHTLGMAAPVIKLIKKFHKLSVE